jgi:uncharacterized membrane protein
MSASASNLPFASRRHDGLRTMFAAVAGVAIAGVVGVLGNWIIVRLSGDGFLLENSSRATTVVLVSFLLTGICIAFGGYLTAKFQNTRLAVSSFIVLELFFGAGMVGQFWREGSTWFTTVSILLVIPCALLGAALASRRGPKWRSD